jgi:hypothetical protein
MSSAGPVEQPVVSVGRVKAYGSVEDLATDSSLVVRARVIDADQQPADRADSGPIMASVATVEVQDALKGSSPATKLTVRVITASSDNSEVPPELRIGQELVLFLQPFEWQRGEPTGEWTVVGGAGIYEVDGSGLKRLSRGPDTIPSRFQSLGDLKERVHRS